MLLHDLHRADNPWLFAVRVVEEGEVALFHGAEVVARGVGADSWGVLEDGCLTTNVGCGWGRR